eukprot:scaffold252724_cov30-Tisochrysis_lutea.AAC.1
MSLSWHGRALCGAVWVAAISYLATLRLTNVGTRRCPTTDDMPAGAQPPSSFNAAPPRPLLSPKLSAPHCLNVLITFVFIPRPTRNHTHSHSTAPTTSHKISASPQRNRPCCG